VIELFLAVDVGTSATKCCAAYRNAEQVELYLPDLLHPAASPLLSVRQHDEWVAAEADDPPVGQAVVAWGEQLWQLGCRASNGSDAPSLDQAKGGDLLIAKVLGLVGAYVESVRLMGGEAAPVQLHLRLLLPFSEYAVYKTESGSQGLRAALAEFRYWGQPVRGLELVELRAFPEGVGLLETGRGTTGIAIGGQRDVSWLHLSGRLPDPQRSSTERLGTSSLLARVVDRIGSLGSFVRAAELLYQAGPKLKRASLEQLLAARPVGDTLSLEELRRVLEEALSEQLASYVHWLRPKLATVERTLIGGGGAYLLQPQLKQLLGDRLEWSTARRDELLRQWPQLSQIDALRLSDCWGLFRNWPVVEGHLRQQRQAALAPAPGSRRLAVTPLQPAREVLVCELVEEVSG
jgi:hypothetical protein